MNATNPLSFLRLLGVALILFVIGCTEEPEDTPVPVSTPKPKPKPEADFSFSRQEIYPQDTISFSDKSLNAASWKWTFPSGDPESSTEQNPVVIFNSIGAYDVNLEVLGTDGETTSSITQKITVKDNKIPPYSGTIFIEPEIIIDEDPTTFLSVTYVGMERVSLFDRRAENFFHDVEVFVYTADYEKDQAVKVYVNSEFTRAQADEHARSYASQMGQLPSFLLKPITELHINDGNHPWSGSRGLMLVHTQQGESYASQGIVAETLLHEASHASLQDLNVSTEYLEVMDQDPTHLSTYARDNLYGEDLAETILLYLAYRYRPDRLKEDEKYNISRLIPNRLQLLDKQGFDVYPW
ncbi:PKD domain-containing protein [Jiulongibacter sp. NS-SX5]|uniref:PKD domain-containing protein n=1 Tax=Jiulongibacter sp. NS-SX5 TaxID=3463854 RepID=UPI004057CCC3